MFQLALPVIKTAAPFVLKAGIATGAYLAASSIGAWIVNSTFRAGAEAATPFAPKRTFAQTVKREMLLFAEGAWDMIRWVGPCALVGFSGVLMMPALPVLGAALALTGVALGITTIVVMVNRMLNKRPSQAVRRQWSKVTAFFDRLGDRIANAARALVGREKWTEIVETNEDRFTRKEKRAANAAERAAAKEALAHETRAADEADPMGEFVKAETNQAFDEEYDRDEAALKVAFPSTLAMMIGLLDENDFRRNVRQATADFVNQLPRLKTEMNLAYKQFGTWLNKSSLTKDQKDLARRQFQMLRHQALNQTA
jgi:hypothetical protein